VNTPAYSYVPGTDYSTQAPNLFAYDDLSNTSTAVPTKPDDEYVMWMPGKFLLENTHKYGSDDGTSQYKQGNTAYVLVRAKFTPLKFADAGTPPSDGTFYVGANDYFIYTSIDAAKAGTLNQGVMKYPQGKVLYYLWLNPDNFARPFNSPVVRNNIYHINIKGFKSFGYNWNPLDPSPSNPDSKPGDNPNEPPSDIDPSFPISSSETYVNIDAEILPWSTHSYENEL
jgi:hypothetical protein